MYKCALITLGCKVNQCETQAIAEMMQKRGYTIVDFNEYADVYIINTCCVTAEGERKSRQYVRRACTKNKNSIIAVTGCAAQKAPDIFEKIENVSIVAGNSKKAQLADMIENKLRGVSVDDMSHFNKYSEMSDSLVEKTRAFIKIQDGCNNFCSYCIIPYVRGRECSRKKENIIAQCDHLAKQGFKEVVLTGIHLSAYKGENGEDIADIVNAVNKINGITRIRLGSLEPIVITKAFMENVMQSSKFCHQYHLSLQSGCDSVLKRMNRHYTTQDFLSSAELIRSFYPDAAVSTDIIVGFPGETEEEFCQTIEFVKKIGFAFVHVFPYSIRPGTVAAKMQDQIEKEVKAERANKLIKVCAEVGKEYRQRFLNRTVEVLCENNENKIQTGLTREHVSVSFESESLSGKEVKVKIKKVTDTGLWGEII